MTDCLQELLRSVAQSLGGRQMTCRYRDLLQPKNAPESGAQIAERVIRNSGLRLRP